MPLISLTRLRLRSPRHLPLFFLYSWGSTRQAGRAPGFVRGQLARDPDGGYWTLTAWADAASMQAYRNTQAHQRAMPKLIGWCDEASVAHYEQPHPGLPSMGEALARMTELGRVSKVRKPSPGHSARQTVPGGRAPVVLRTFGATPVP